MGKTVFYVLKKVLSEVAFFLNQSIIVYVVLTPVIITLAT